MEFELKRLVDYSDGAILEEIHRVSKIVPDGAITVSIFENHARVSVSAVRRRFGTFVDALNAAGLANRSSDFLAVRGAHPSSKMSDDDILSALKNLSTKLQKPEITIRDVDRHLPFSATTLRKRFGGSHKAFEAAGLATAKLGRRYTDEECFDNMLNVWTHHARPPSYQEMSEPPSEVGGKAYTKRFGTWNKALAAFVERVNQDREAEALENDEPPVSTHPSQVTGPSQVTSRTADERRDISIGLRFRVLHRDRFKCVLCGDHPARNADCVLHVDHILPWSRGGKTREDNLRTLCATCNVGRGNRFIE
jgi:hypothetical protein